MKRNFTLKIPGFIVFLVMASVFLSSCGSESLPLEKDNHGTTYTPPSYTSTDTLPGPSGNNSKERPASSETQQTMSDNHGSTDNMNKLEPALYKKLQSMSQEEIIKVGIWMNGRAEYAAVDVAAKYPEAHLIVVEYIVRPSKETDMELFEKIKAEMREAVKQAYKEEQKPIIEFIESKGCEVTYAADYSPIIFAIVFRDVIFELSQMSIVSTIYQSEAGVTPTLTGLPAESCPKTLKELPIEVGDGLLELGGSGNFNGDIIDTWITNDLIISSNGSFNGTIITQYSGELFSTEFKDVLLLQVTKMNSDYFVHEISPLMPFIAQDLNDKGAVFTFSGSFEVPSLEAENKLLARLEFRMSWIRVYKINGELYYQILPGNEERYSGSFPKTNFDEPLNKPLNGRFDHYSGALNQNSLPYNGGFGYKDFNYCNWIKENVKW